MSLQNKLIEYGLTDKEALIYLSGMELGPSPVQKIAKHAGINRVTAYAVIDTLMKKGLMSTYEEGKRTVYVASEPESLMNIFEQQKRDIERYEEDLKKILPEFRSKYNIAEGKPKVRYYEGLDGVVAMNDETFEKFEGEELLTAYNKENSDKYFSDELRNRLKKTRISKDMNIKIIYTSDSDLLPDRPKAEILRIEDPNFPIQADVAIFGDKVRFVSFSDRISGIVIEDVQIATTLKSIFELAAKALKK